MMAEPCDSIVYSTTSFRRGLGRARNQKWYLTGRLITVHDISSFDPTAQVSLDDFVDLIGRTFQQPADGLGFDNSPVAHLWRVMIWPTKYL